jgi:hypothetical protein
MALIDLSLVTKTLVGLLATRVRASADWPSGAQPDGGAALEASPGPPDQVNADRALSFYLYHVREDAHTKAQDWEVSDAHVPQQFKPMGLTLYYVMCPRSNMSLIPERTYAEQLIMGLAVKTLHDFPVIDDSTFMLDRSAVLQPVLDSKLRNRRNKLRVLMQPTPNAEAMQFWQAGSQPLRMAAYYEVNAMLLEPEVAKSRRTRVSLVGVHPILRGQPLIEGTRNRLSFLVPGELDPRTAECSPAEVSLGEILDVFGADLKGDVTALLLSHTDFAEPIPVDPAWQMQSNGSLLSVEVQASIATSGGPQALLPGVYGAIVRTTARRNLPNGTQRDFDSFSNEAAFAITPKVLGISALAADLSGTVTVDGFVPALLANGALALFAGAEKLQRIPVGPLAAGQFFTEPGPSQVIQFRLPSATLPETAVPLRLVVRGAECAPRWSVTPP